jgi:translation elongation factor EF-1alpha
VPERKTDAALRLPISGIYKIKGVGDVLAGRVEQGIVKPGDEVIFMPTHTLANKCEGKVRAAAGSARGLCVELLLLFFAVLSSACLP